ncbi:MAG: ferritin-like domain-containing protein, partial [Desulfobacterales bacterium]
LSDAVQALGETPPEASRGLKGYVLEAFTALGGFVGMQGAMKALKVTEEITNHYYAEALPKDTPPTIKDIVRQHLSEEQIHMEYLNLNS